MGGGPNWGRRRPSRKVDGIRSLAQTLHVASKKTSLVGRGEEIEKIKASLRLGRNLLIEGPVGVGKTYLVREALKELGLDAVRVDGDSRYTEQKLTGWFDPPLVLKKGYSADTFIPGPLVEAMRGGRILFINELNRMPEGVQNILLPALDEHRIQVPHLGEIKAKKGFSVIGTQNPREFTATHALAEALLDRFEWVRLGYQSEDEERAILQSQSKAVLPVHLESVLRIVRASRKHPAIKRGASIRAGLAVCELLGEGLPLEDACSMALASRIEALSPDDDLMQIIRDLISQSVPDTLQKKNETRL